MENTKKFAVLLLVSMYCGLVSCGRFEQPCYKDQAINITLDVRDLSVKPPDGEICDCSVTKMLTGNMADPPGFLPLIIDPDCSGCTNMSSGILNCSICLHLGSIITSIFDLSEYRFAIERNTRSLSLPWSLQFSSRVGTIYTGVFFRLLLEKCEEDVQMDTAPILRETAGGTGASPNVTIAGWCIAVGLGVTLVALLVFMRISKRRKRSGKREIIEQGPRPEQRVNQSAEPCQEPDTQLGSSANGNHDRARSEHRYSDIQVDFNTGSDGYLHPISGQIQHQTLRKACFPYQGGSTCGGDVAENLPLYQ